MFAETPPRPPVRRLTASGLASTSYTSVTIRPVGAGRIIEGSIVGAIIRLNGADNVTIDGRQGGAGSARDLTVRNNSTSTATAAIWLSSVAALNVRRTTSFAIWRSLQVKQPMLVRTQQSVF
jgi:hypothetical protein